MVGCITQVEDDHHICTLSTQEAHWLSVSKPKKYRHALTWTLSRTFWAYAHTRTPAHVYPAHMHAHTFPRPIDSSANLLLLFMSISPSCYFSVFSSVCITSNLSIKKKTCGASKFRVGSHTKTVPLSAHILHVIQAWSPLVQTAKQAHCKVTKWVFF